MPAPPCQPGCRCGKHLRTPEHNARIGISVSLTGEATGWASQRAAAKAGAAKRSRNG